MVLLIFLLSYVCLVSSHNPDYNPEYSRVCYYTNWAQYRAAPIKFFPENVDPELCTEIIIAFSRIKDNRILEYEWNDYIMIPRVVALKKQNPKLKVLIAVGGYNHENTLPLFRNMSSDSHNRKLFIDSVLAFIDKYQLDGLDLDWEYPTLRPTPDPKDKKYFTILCKELKEAFKGKYLLTAAVSANPSYISKAYEVKELYDLLDSLNLMSYDLAGSWNGKTGLHTATKNQKFTVIKAIDALVKNGFKEDKIVLGLATYGRSFNLSDANVNGIGANSTGGGEKGRFTGLSGFLSYYEICELKSQGMKEVYDKNTEVPYGVKGNLWIGYENVDSIKRKVKYLIKKRGLKGAMFWSLPLDDFSGTFCGAKYPLMNAVKTELLKGCKAVGVWREVRGMYQWCVTNCAVKFCPASHCKCM